MRIYYYSSYSLRHVRTAPPDWAYIFRSLSSNVPDPDARIRISYYGETTITVEELKVSPVNCAKLLSVPKLACTVLCDANVFPFGPH